MYTRLLKMCIVQHVEMKKVFNFRSTNLPVSTTVSFSTRYKKLCVSLFQIQNPRGNVDMNEALLWKTWSLVVFSKSSFYVARARKDEKISQNALFLLKKNFSPGKQLFMNVPFQSIKYREKELPVDNKVH